MSGAREGGRKGNVLRDRADHQIYLLEELA